jgi:hypothetical protein
MPVSDIPLDGSQILRYLTQVADRLGPVGEQHTIIVVGGSLLALRDLRATTLDVDSVRKLSSELAQAVAAVGADNGLGPTWLNDNASMFTPATVTSLTARSRNSLGYFLGAGTGPLSRGFRVPTSAGALHEEVDPYLEDHIISIAAAAEPGT